MILYYRSGAVDFRFEISHVFINIVLTRKCTIKQCGIHGSYGVDSFLLSVFRNNVQPMSPQKVLETIRSQQIELGSEGEGRRCG